MKSYTSIPTSSLWRKDMGLTGIIKMGEFPALERISELLDMYYKADDRLRALKYEVVAQAYRHTQFIIKNKDNKEKLGTALWASRVETVQALNAYLYNHFMQNEFADDFGKDVSASGQHEDASAVSSGGMQWYQDKAARTQFKLSFRNGVANRWTFSNDGRKLKLEVYDTDKFGDNLEEQMSLYVMDTGGRLYCSGKEGEQQLKHSSFLAGDRVLCAGTMRVENGKVVAITGKSGHYKPTVQQMLNALERLRAYQVNLSKLTVYRENYKDSFKAAKPRYFEPCSATELIKLRAWPSQNPYSMHISP